MAADPVLSRELKSLEEELSVGERERAAARDVQTASNAGTSVSRETAELGSRPEDSADEQEFRKQFGDLFKEITEFVEGVEKNISGHPAMTVLGAMLLGILIGRLLARR